MSGAKFDRLHYRLRPFVAVALFLGSLLHREVTDGTEEECVNKITESRIVADPNRQGEPSSCATTMENASLPKVLPCTLVQITW